MILITGCAGYIGSELCKKLEKSNINYVGIDSLKYSYSENIYNKKKFIKSCISNKRLLLNLIKKFKVNTIIHCAAYAYINDGEIHKKKYYLKVIFSFNHRLIFISNLASRVIKSKWQLIQFR